ncbi:PEPxxWA-CTERM sorting domain-containing protein [Phenylobacterium sp.]|uniref:PEPxxWA-CTERM sorting domain-containing protein n=1 Tax=Phenylobacterium sp. TaxID=1871053 RepID=UPI0025CBCEB4|nr:PEPxxWA-CTERM sorting domain-containing protein [Phenylobacterium sp.]
MILKVDADLRTATMKMMFYIAVGALMVAAAPASAARVHYHFAGTIDAVLNPASALGVMVGDAAVVDVFADPAARVDVTAAANAAFGAHYTRLEAASLDHPGDSLQFFVHLDGGDLIQLYGSDQLGSPDPLLHIPAPYVLFNSGRFFGVGFAGANALGEAIFTAGASPQRFDFVGGDIRAPGPSFGGHFDYSNTPGVPEPASWALLILGFGLIGAAMRRRPVAVVA